MSEPTPTDVLGVDDASVVQQVVLSVIEGPDEGAKIIAAGNCVVIGTSEQADLQLKDTAVSRFHCELSLTPAGLVVRDLGSRNGVKLGSAILREAVVPMNSVLQVGRNRVLCAPAADVSRIELSKEPKFGQLVGASLSMRRAFAVLERAAASDATVLLTGETGTGKEVAARGLHDRSARAKASFVVVDCASVPANLFEAELFGHEKGAFTGAIGSREGAFEMANGGTLFIDEIGELALELQPKLLRVLERREVKRVGGAKTLPVDVRVVAATHRDLRAEVNAKRFRADLYYRLAVVNVPLPALRERPEDMSLLVASLAPSIAERVRAPADRLLEPTFIEELVRHSWPGNVRELRNYLERALVLGETSPFEPEAPATPGASVEKRSLRLAREAAIATFERAYLADVLERAGNQVTRAAQLAEVDRVHFYRLLWKYGFRTPKGAPAGSSSE